MAIKIRRGTNADRLTVVLEEGEVAYTTDTKKFYIGDGTTLGGNEIGVDKVPYTGATQDVNLGEFGVQLGNLEFDVTPTNIPTAQGAVYWDDNAETLALIMNGTTQKVGEDTFYHVRNTTGSTIPKGTAVRFAGTTGNSGRLLIAPMIANGTTPSQYYMGVTSEEILDNADGKVYQFGKMRGVNTSAFTDGDILYVSTTTAGGFQTTPPTAPNNIIVAAAVVHAANNGTLMIRPTLGSNINSDEGVLITTPANNEVLTYESSTSLWKNKTVETALGYTPVPTTRTLTINGTTQDLSADRTFTIATGLTVGTTPITSGTVGRILFEGTGNVLQQSANLFWDNTNSRLGIGTASPATQTQIVGTATSSILTLTSGTRTADFGVYGAGGFCEIGSNGNFSLAFKSNAITRMIVLGNGNIGIGTTTDAGYKLNVNGTARVSGTLQSTYISFRTSDSLTAIYPTNDGFTLAANGNAIRFQSNTFSTAQYGYNFVNSNSTRTWTTGTGGDILVQSTYAPTSGSGVYNVMQLNQTINQTGGANGITRGLYINPTLTAAADFRAIETTAGNVLFGASGTGFYWDNTNSRLGIGTATPTTVLDVNGTARVQGVLSADVGISSGGTITFSNTGTTSRTGFSFASYSNNLTTGALIGYNTTFTFNPSSGSATYTGFHFNTTINQSGSASGITRGIYIQPAIGNAVDFRAIETTAGKVCLNTTSGNTLIGTTTDAGYKLDVNGTMRVIGATTLGTTSASNITTIATNGSSNILNVTNTAGTFVFGVDSAGGYAQPATANRGMWFYNSSASAYIGAAASGCIAINTTSPNASAILDVVSTTKGVLFPRMTTTQKNAIASPAAGLVVYDTTLGKLCVRGATAWETITSV